MRKRNSSTPRLDHKRSPLNPSWKQLALCALAMALSVLSLHAQLKTRQDVGINIGPNCSDSGPCPGVCNQPLPDIKPLAKPVVVNDEKCLPWNLSAAQASPSRVKALKVPSKARDEYTKACIA